MHITVIDRHNYHLFQPLLYQVATAALSPGDIASPIRHILRRFPNVHVRLGEAVAVDLARRRVQLSDGELWYDQLIVATGATHSYFGHDEWAPLAPGLKTLDDALEIRRRLLLSFEEAEKEEDPGRREAWLTFVVVGGGATGVELAGAIAEIARHTVARDFRAIDTRQAKVLLLEGTARVLPAYAEELSAKAEASLCRMGVEVRKGQRVTEVGPKGVRVGEAFIPARTVLWAAGVAASALAQSLGVTLDRAGRVEVEPDLTVPGHPDAYVIGDLASFPHQTGKPLPGLAPVAIQMGRAAAKNIWASLNGRPRTPFHYKDRGVMATIGRAAGVAQLGKLKLSGFIGWVAWLVVHLISLIGFKNRVLVLLQWTWSYLTFKRGARLITGQARQRVD